MCQEEIGVGMEVDVFGPAQWAEELQESGQRR